MTTLRAGTSTTTSTTIMTTTPGELAYYIAPPPAVGRNRQYVLRYAVRLPVHLPSERRAAVYYHLLRVTRYLCTISVLNAGIGMYLRISTSLVITVERVCKLGGQTHFYGGGIHFDNMVSKLTCSVIHFITLTVTPNFKCILFKQGILLE